MTLAIRIGKPLREIVVTPTSVPVPSILPKPQPAPKPEPVPA